MTSELHAGLTGEATATVEARTLASAMGSGDVPVYATPAMIALMEQAAVAALAPHLQPGATSVGVRIDVRHLAASPAGRTIRAQARLTLVDGRRLTFRVQAFDGSEQIGDGVHERVIVDREKFLQRSAARA